MTRFRFSAAATLAITVALAGVTAPAQAASVGLYGSAGAGVATWEDWGDWDGGADGWDRDTRHTGAGFALETPTGIFRFSYRLGIGWERIVSEGESSGPDSELEGLVIDQDLTYDLFASPAMRFWIGPELRLGFLHGSFDDVSGGGRSFVAAGLGPVFGLDVALSPSVALSWKLGYLIDWYSDDEDSWSDDHHDSFDDNSIEEGHGYISLAVLFRLWGGPQPGLQPTPYQPQGRW